MDDAAPGQVVEARYEAGIVVVDNFHHAARRSLVGRVALCGAGRISQTLSRRFGGDDLDCPECARMVAQEFGRSR